MPHHIPPGCDLACQTKIIINSGNIVGIARSNHAAIDHTLKHLNPEQMAKFKGGEVIELLNRMEDDAVAVQKLIVEGVGYMGEVGKMLT